MCHYNHDLGGYADASIKPIQRPVAGPASVTEAGGTQVSFTKAFVRENLARAQGTDSPCVGRHDTGVTKTAKAGGLGKPFGLMVSRTS